MTKEDLIYLKYNMIEILNEMSIHPLYKNNESNIIIRNEDYDYQLYISTSGCVINISLGKK